MHFLKILACVVFSSALSAQNSTDCSQVEALLNAIKDRHFQPRNIDDAYSKLVFDQFLTLIDSGVELLTEEDIQQLAVFEEQLDDLIEKSDCSFVNLADSLLIERLKQVRTFIDSLEPGKPIGKVEVLQENNNRVAQEDLKDHWQQLLRYYTVLSYFMNAEKGSFRYVDYEAQYVELFEKMKAITLCRLTELEAEISEGGLIENYYLKSLAYGFDPHTDYFPALEQEAFASSLAASDLSFGFSVSQNLQGEVILDYIHPGGPAWDSNKMNKGDVLMQVSTASESFVFECGYLNAAFKLISDDELKTAEFKLRKKNGVIEEVSLVKEFLDQEDNSVNGYKLSDEEVEIGYVYLPAFYASGSDNPWEIQYGCSADLTKELIKMKRENISGLILDLRNNGGGSMAEALAIAGAFVDKGSLTIVSDGSELTNLKDMNRGVSFAGPLVVLVNGWSASASELLAGTLQDHGRAVVVGEQTFGKSTIQEILPLDKAFVKLTTSAFYRVTGSTHQGKGVLPDILIPDSSTDNSYREADYSSLLDLGPVEKKTYYTKSSNGLDDSIRRAAKQRISKNSQADKKKEMDILSFETLLQLTNEEKNPTASTLEKQFSAIHLHKNVFNAELESIQEILDELEQDPMIIESYQILKDIIEKSKSK